MPVALESRAAFVKRLLAAVKWVNEIGRAGQEKRYSANQKKRADECLRQKPKGGRTEW